MRRSATRWVRNWGSSEHAEANELCVALDLPIVRQARIERAFRSLESVDLTACPIYRHLAERMRKHVFFVHVCYYAGWYTRQALAPLFDEDDRLGADVGVLGQRLACDD